MKAGDDLYLDWRPLYRELKSLVLPADTQSVVTTAGSHSKTSLRTLVKICAFAQLYFDPSEVPEMLEEFLPYFTTSSTETAFAVIGLLNILLPTSPAPIESKWQPQHFLPSFFHLWSLMSRSKAADLHMLDVMSRIARDCLVCEHIKFSAFGMFTEEQASNIFTASLRMLEIPVSQVTSAYSPIVDLYQGTSSILDRDQRKQPVAYHVARWIIMSLSPESATASNSILTKLEGLIQAIETFYHPSNSGHWTRNLSQLVFYLSDFFVMRWNRERSAEMAVPEGRRLTDAVKRRFVLCVREVTFLGIFAKSGTAMTYSLSSLQSLAYLEPKLILPGALQRIYPAMRGLVEVHRTTSSLRALHELTRVMTKTKGFRCHVTSLLGLALPGIDANDLTKTQHTLMFMQGLFYEIPMVDLTESAPGSDEPKLDGMLAAEWVTNQIERLEVEGVDIEIDYDNEMSDQEEINIVRSSTAEFRTFLTSFLDSVFSLLRNLPDAARLKTGSPEENIANALPAAFTPMVSSISADLYDLVLDKVVDFVSRNTVYQARDAIAFICSSLCKVDSKKALGVLVPILVRNIRSEIDDNGAGLSRTTGSEVLPKDKALIYNISLLSMSLVHAGSALMQHAEELTSIASYMQEKCKGIAATHASNLVHHMLLTLTMTYTVDHSLFDESDIASGITPAHWANRPDPHRLNIKWHYADEQEIKFAVKFFRSFAERETKRLKELISDNSPVKRDGSGKQWSDEVSRSLVLLKLLISGTAPLFDSRHDVGVVSETIPAVNGSVVDGDQTMGDDDDDDNPTDADLGATEDEDVKPTFQFPTGYPLVAGDPNYVDVHEVRTSIGETLHDVHQFLTTKQQDDVTAFNALYSTVKCWFVDVGFERSAHVLDRVVRLLAADITPFKFSGLRKEYPRPLLVRRAYVYHLQRLRHNASPRHKTQLDVELLRDLVQSSVSTYTEIRRTAQTAIESTMKVLIGARPVILPPLLDHFEKSVMESDFPRIKGSMYTLLFGSLAKPLGRDWRYTPSLLRTYVNVMDVDKLSIQKIASAAAIQTMDMTRQGSRTVILDQKIVESIASSTDAEQEKERALIDKRHRVIQKRYKFIRKERSKLSDELAEVASKSHWKKESRTATLVIGLSLRFEDITSEAMIDLVVKRSVDPHPSLRAVYLSALIGLFTYIDMRALSDHKYENLLMDKQKVPSFVKTVPDRDDPKWTEKYLSQFATAEAESYIDLDYPGWLAWGTTIPAFKSSEQTILEYDDVEQAVRSRVGKMLDRKWFSTLFDYMKQEPRDTNSDRFRLTTVIGLTFAFNFVFTGQTPTTFEDLKELITNIFGGGTDKHQHRATAEILAALVDTVITLDVSIRSEVWSFAFPIIRGVFEEGMTPENSSYWTAFLDVVLQNKDPRRSWPLVEWLSEFRLDMTTNAAFKESSKITLLEHSILGIGWHFRLDKPIIADFLEHLDHPYKGVREVMGQTLSYIYRIQYHESHKDVPSFVEKEKAVSSIGSRPYQPTPEFDDTIHTTFSRIEKWRQERPPGQQTASSYTSGSKTLISWLENTLQSFECTQLTPYFHDTFLESLLHMMDVKEDPELQAHAYSVFRHLGNIPYRSGEEAPFVDACIRIGRNATSWHQRLRIMINMQAIYFRHLFLMPQHRQRALFTAITEMLEDIQLEVRVGAGATLSGMIRCSPVALRNEIISDLTSTFTTMLKKHPLPRGKRAPGSTTSPEQTKLTITRHAAVVGLGALVQAFPYTSPPPKWIPGVLTTLATRAASDPGVVGKSAKGLVSDFKKTRQDTWHIDVKVRWQFYLGDMNMQG